MANDDDCNDMDILVYAGAPEICNNIDDDCDGLVDDKATGGMTYFADADNDGYGDDTVPVIACSDPSDSTMSYVLVGGDCDDNEATTNPSAADVCDGVDNKLLWR